MTLLGRLLRRRPRPAREVLDLRLTPNGALRRSHPPGGWRCGVCGAPAVYVQTWPGRGAGWSCAEHAPR